MGTGYGYRAGCRFCSRRCGNDCLARGYCSYFARGRINGCNRGLICRPNYCVGRIGRSDRCCQTGVTVTGSQRQFVLVKSNAGCRLRRSSDIDGCGDNSNLFGISCFIGSQSLIKGYTVRFCHSVAVNGALKCHQRNFARVCVVFRTVSVQKQRFFRPVKSIPAECGFNSVGGLSAACNIGKSAWNFQSTFQSKNDTYLLHVNGESDCFTGIC